MSRPRFYISLLMRVRGREGFLFCITECGRMLRAKERTDAKPEELDWYRVDRP